MPASSVRNTADMTRHERPRYKQEGTVVLETENGDRVPLQAASDYDLAMCLERAPLWVRRLAAHEWLKRNVAPVKVETGAPWWRLHADAQARGL